MGLFKKVFRRGRREKRRNRAAQQQVAQQAVQITQKKKEVKTTEQRLTELKKNNNASNKLIVKQKVDYVKQYDDMLQMSHKNYLTNLAKIAPKLRIIPRSDKQVIAVVGQINAGKSTLSNKLANKRVARVGNGEVTKQPQRIHISNTFELYDFPGLTSQKPNYTFDEIKLLLKMTKIVILYESSVKEVINLIELANALKLNIVLTRTKCDLINVDEDEFTLTEYILVDKNYLTVFDFNHTIFPISIKNVNDGKRNVFDWELFLIELLKKN